MNTRAAIAIGVVLLSAAQIAQQAPWSEVRGDRFVLRAPLSGASLNMLACDVGDAASAIGSALPTGNPSVIGAGSEQGVRELLPQFWERRLPRPLGAQWSGIYGSHVVIRTDGTRRDRRRRALHELAHAATRRAHPEAPRWFDEGVSVLWENAQIDKQHVELGQPVAVLLKHLRGEKDWIAISTLSRAASISEGGSESKPSAFYAQSWALVHYLLFEKKSASISLERIPQDLPADEELRRYVRGMLAPPQRLALAAGSECGGETDARRITPIEALVARARAAADAEWPGAALPLLDEILRREPRHAEALEILGHVQRVAR